MAGETIYNSIHTGEQIDSAVAWLLKHAQDHICGGAAPGTTIETPSDPTYWFAGAGAYVCGSSTISIPDGRIGIISYDGSDWSSVTFDVGKSTVYLDSMGEELDGTPVHIDPGMVIYDPDQSTIKKCTAPGVYETIGCNENVLYCNKVTNTLYRWDTSSINMIQVGAAKFKVINNLTTGGVNDGLSAEMGKTLKGKIDEVQANVVNLYNRLANMAFPTAADKAAAKPAELDWSIPKVAVTITNSIGSGIAVIKRNGQAVSGSVLVDQGDSLTLTIEGADGYGLTSVSAAVDGGLATPLPGVNGVFTLNVAQVNAAMAIVITGTYSQTVGITYNLSHCTKTSGQTSVVTGGGATIEITADEGYTLQSVTPTVTGATIDSWTLNAGVGTLVISNVTGAVEVSATAALAGQVTVDSTGSENATITDNGASEGGTLVLTIDPNAGYGFAAADSNDATDVFRGEILITDGNDNAIVDTVNGVGLDKISCGAITPPTANQNLWSRIADAQPTVVTIDNAPSEVSVVAKPAILLQRNAYVTASKTFARNQNSIAWTCVCPPVRLPMPFQCAVGDQFVYGPMVAGDSVLSAAQPAQLMISDADTNGSYWGTNSANERGDTIQSSYGCVGSSHWAAVFDFGEISSCFLKYKKSGNSDWVMLFDGSIKSSYIYVEDPTL